MAGEVQGRKIAFPMSNEGVEEVEPTRPLAAVRANPDDPRTDDDAVAGQAA